MLATWLECTNASPHPFVMVTLHGHFKGETGLQWHCLPLAVHNHSQIPYKLWIGRLLRCHLMEEGRQGGWLFSRPDGSRKTFSDYDPFLLDYPGRARVVDPSIMSSLADIQDFSLWRSHHAGATTEAANRGIPSSTVNLIGRWRKRESAKGSEPSLPMRQVYTRVRDCIEGLLIFSRSL